MAKRQTIQFGTDGWRAIIAEGFTFENVEVVTAAVARYLLHHFGSEKPVVIGYDTRFMADQFAAHAAAILQSHGFSVLLTETFTPTPVVAFAAKDYGSAGALMFTASHNPPEYCGIKFIPHYAGPATPDITNELMKHVQSIEQEGRIHLRGDKTATLERFSPYERYVNFLAQQVDFSLLAKRPLKVLYDSMHGAGQNYLPRLFTEKAGYAIDVLHHGRDPLFGNRIPEPKAEYLPELIETLNKGGYDLGLANDGDADRFGILDEKGNYISANQVLPLLFRYLYQRRGYRGSVVRTLATSNLLDRLAERYEVPVHETPVGFKYVGELMRREAVIIGGEESGGLSILGHIPEKDGLLVNLLVAEMIAVEQKPLSQIYQDLLAEAGLTLYNKSTNLHLTEAQKQQVMDYFKALTPGQSFGTQVIETLDTRDGYKLMFGPYRWLLVRPSGTEPILRVYMESLEATDLESFEKTLQQLLETSTPLVC